MKKERLGAGLIVALAGCSASNPPAVVPPTEAAPPPAAEETIRVPAEAAETAPIRGVDLDTVTAGRFDNGKMWTFEYPPLEYFRHTYGFVPDDQWFERAQLGALRLPNCSASFVSPHGLVLTNHHCARESVSQVSADGEKLLDNGFYASTLEGERAIDDIHADQLIEIIDLSAQIDSAYQRNTSQESRQEIRETLGEEIAEARGGEDAGVVVEVIELWNGAKTSAYVFKRHEDVRLVMAPELQLGYFGGDPDNFTFPRYALDMSFLRIYDDDGEPLEPEHFFQWTETGVAEGDAIFIIGNPGSTSRLQTVSELEFRGAVSDKATVAYINSRVAALQSFYDEFPEEAEALDLRNEIFSLLNAQKAYSGMLGGLQDPVTIARRAAAERDFRAAIDKSADPSSKFGGLFDKMERIQNEKRELAAELSAFLGLGNPGLTPGVLLRGIFAFQYLSAQGGGAPSQALEGIMERLESVSHQPRALQERLLAARLADIEQYFGKESDIARELLMGRSADQVAKAIVNESQVADSAAASGALINGMVRMTDPAVRLAAAMLPRFGAFQSRFASLSDEEETVARQLGLARYDVYGSSIPPDATFSLRIADGVVKGYEYNGTVAPAKTTFFGLYDHFHSYGAESDWKLPNRWLNPPASFDLSTPLNFVSTADIIGGNSGSPILNSELELVGVVFDGNIESLPGDYIYVPDRNRAIGVDARGMLEALDEIYDADRLVLELTTGTLASSEEEADRIRRR